MHLFHAICGNGCDGSERKNTYNKKLFFNNKLNRSLMENVRDDVEQHDVQRAIDTILSSEGLAKKV